MKIIVDVDVVQRPEGQIRGRLLAGFGDQEVYLDTAKVVEAVPALQAVLREMAHDGQGLTLGQEMTIMKGLGLA